MLTIAELNEFLIKHADAKYFADDLRLYKKHFPNSRLIPELDRAPDFAKKPLDERMLTELLANNDSCIDCIWENRGYVRNQEKQILPAPKLKAEKKTVIPAETFEGSKYNVLKKMIFDLDLQKHCKDQKKETYLNVLRQHQPVPATAIPKKKEGRALNSRE